MNDLFLMELSPGAGAAGLKSFKSKPKTVNYQNVSPCVHGEYRHHFKDTNKNSDVFPWLHVNLFSERRTGYIVTFVRKTA